MLMNKTFQSETDLRREITRQRISDMEKAKKFRVRFSVILILIGIATILFAVINSAVGDPGYFEYTSYEYYGGDAYSGMQQASADASNNARNIGYLAQDIAARLAAILIVIGVLILLAGIYACKVAKLQVCVPNSIEIDTLVSHYSYLIKPEATATSAQ